MVPIPAAPIAAHNRLMSQLAIRLHPCVPVSPAELYQWLEEQVGGLRADAPEGTIRLSSLTQAMPTRELGMGWLVELDLPDTESFLRGARCTALLRDLQLLGLQPTVLSALDPLDVAVPSHRHLPVPVAGDVRTDEWETIATQAELDRTGQPAARLAGARSTGAHSSGGSSQESSLRRSPNRETGAAASDSPGLFRVPATLRRRPTRRKGGRSE